MKPILGPKISHWKKKNVLLKLPSTIVSIQNQKKKRLIINK